MRAFDDYRKEMETLELLYVGTVFSYNRVANDVHDDVQSGTSDECCPLTCHITGYPDAVQVARDSDQMRINLRSWYQRHLREVIFVRAISTLEVFLVNVVKEIFLCRPDLFRRSGEVSIPNDLLLSFTSVSSLNTFFINKEARELQNKGFIGMSSFYKQRLGIDFDTFGGGAKALRELHERRHLLVHRLGRTDEKYRHSYGVATKQLEVGRTYLREAFALLNTFGEYINGKANKLTKNVSRPVSKPTPTCVAKIIVKPFSKRGRAILRTEYMFEVNEQVVALEDLISFRHIADGGLYTIELKGDYAQIRSYLDQLQSFATGGSLEVVEQVVKKQGTAARPVLSDVLMKKISAEIPCTEVPEGLKRSLSEKFGISVNTIAVAVREIQMARRIKSDFVSVEHDYSINDVAEKYHIKLGYAARMVGRIRKHVY